MTNSNSNAVPSIVSMILFTVLAAAMFGILPLLVGALMDISGLSARQAGLIAGADMLGACIGALATSCLIPGGRWRIILLTGIILLSLANAVSGISQQFVALCVCRIAAGLGEGVLLTISNASIGETRTPDRVFGMSTASQVAFASPALYLMPVLLGAYGLRGIFWIMAALTAASVVLLRYMPDYARSAETLGPLVQRARISAQSAFGLAGVFVFFLAQGAVWAYLDRIGIANGIDPEAVARALAMCSIAGFLGAALSSWLDVRQGRLKPLFVATTCATASLLVLSDTTRYLVFAATACVLNFSWNFAIPYQFGTLAALDPSRRTVALGSGVIFGGLAAGPVIAAALVTENSYRNVDWLGIIFCVLSFAFFLRLLLPARPPG